MRKNRLLSGKVLALFLTAILLAACSNEPEIIKQQIRIPMRDGILLFTTIYYQVPLKQPASIILVRTNFGSHPYQPEEIPEWIPPDPSYLEDGYIVVIQDVRGTFMSEGEWRRMNMFEKNEDGASESTDTWDTTEWLVKNVAGNNGRVCLWGGSFSGTYALAGLVDKHPAVVCSVPQGPSSDWWGDDVFHNGALQLAHVFWGFADFGTPTESPSSHHNPIKIAPATTDGYEFLLKEVGGLTNVNRKFFQNRSPSWNELVEHPARGEFWQQRNVHHFLQPTDAAILLVGGWFDAEDLYGALQTYKSLTPNNDEEGKEVVFVIGPWEHVQWQDGNEEKVGEITYPDSSPARFRSEFQKPFFDYHLKEKGVNGEPLLLPRVSIYDTGNLEWRRFRAWPPEPYETCTLQIAGKGQLSWGTALGDAGGEIAFPSDPANPVPSWERKQLGMDPHYMNADQRIAEVRQDVLTFISEPLTEPLTLAGPVDISLFVKTSGQDSDWVVKVIDLFPDGGEIEEKMIEAGFRPGHRLLVRGDIFRGRYRKGLDRAVPFQPDVPDQVTFALNNVLHTFGKGHRLMVQIHSTWFPLFDRNPQNWVDNIFLAEDDDFSAQTHTVLYGKGAPSALSFRALGACPE